MNMVKDHGDLWLINRGRMEPLCGRTNEQPQQVVVDYMTVVTMVIIVSTQSCYHERYGHIISNSVMEFVVDHDGNRIGRSIAINHCRGNDLTVSSNFPLQKVGSLLTWIPHEKQPKNEQQTLACQKVMDPVANNHKSNGFVIAFYNLSKQAIAISGQP